MRQWFESLPSRDQIALMALVAALGLWLFVQLIFIELDGRRARLTEGNEVLAEKLIRVDLKVEQLAALRAGGGDQKINLTRTHSVKPVRPMASLLNDCNPIAEARCKSVSKAWRSTICCNFLSR